jgi:hypothetical protein
MQIRIHPLSALAGAAFVVLVGATQAPARHQQTGASENALFQHLRLVQVRDAQGNLVPTVVVSGANLQVVNGLGATNGQPADPQATDPLVTETNGLGNLIVGYNEDDPYETRERGGSHNVILGQGQEFTSFGGLIAGRSNASRAPYASVAGGLRNLASGTTATVLGGAENEARGEFATIGGGTFGLADGTGATVSGGFRGRSAGYVSTVSGGARNYAGGDAATVGGGSQNRALAIESVVSGGLGRVADGFVNWVAGALQQDS